MLGVFSDDDEVPAVDAPDAEANSATADRMSDNMAAEAEATEMATETTEMATETTEMASEAASTAEAAPESVEAMSETAEEEPEESGFFQKVQDLF